MMIAARNSFLMSGAKLPYDAEVEYLASTGAEYVDTGLVSYNSSTAAALKLVRYEGRVMPIRPPSDRYLMGCNSWGFWGVDSSRAWRYRTSALGSWADDTYYDVKVVFSGASGGGMWVDDVKLNNPGGQAGNANTYGLGIFCIGDSGGVVAGSFAGKWRVASMVVESMGVVRDFIPVRVGSGSSARGYLYDRVSGALFGNAADGGNGFPAACVGPDK